MYFRHHSEFRQSLALLLNDQDTRGARASNTHKIWRNKILFIRYPCVSALSHSDNVRLFLYIFFTEIHATTSLMVDMILALLLFAIFQFFNYSLLAFHSSSMHLLLIQTACDTQKNESQKKLCQNVKAVKSFYVCVWCAQSIEISEHIITYFGDFSHFFLLFSLAHRTESASFWVGALHISFLRFRFVRRHSSISWWVKRATRFLSFPFLASTKIIFFLCVCCNIITILRATLNNDYHFLLVGFVSERGERRGGRGVSAFFWFLFLFIFRIFLWRWT